MPDPRNTLQQLFTKDSRFDNFGEILVSLHVQGFRCHTNTLIEVESPITAFSGLNGTGKSTLLQLGAVAYNKSLGNNERYHIPSFVVAGKLDPQPYTDAASVEYGYWQDNRIPRKLTVTRRVTQKRWSGYRSQPIRRVYFAGMGLYLPQIETRDFAVRNASKLQILNCQPLAPDAKQWVERILGNHYDGMDRNTIKHPKQARNVVTAARGIAHYSEANMGCGEGRVQHVIQQLEDLPERSLVLFEEPETSLHQSAQFELGRYLIDVCIRRRHQVLLTTHSESLLAGLPSASRIYLDRGQNEIRPIAGLSGSQAASLMGGGAVKALHILVEDEVARAVLREIVRLSDPQFLKVIGVHPVGDKGTIQKTMQALAGKGIPIAAVRDGDVGQNPGQNLFSLPGNEPPEKEVLQKCPEVAQMLSDEYGLTLPDFMAGVDPDEHHSWFLKLSSATACEAPVVITACARVYARSLTANTRDALVQQLKAAITR
jgi:predicted ATPase